MGSPATQAPMPRTSVFYMVLSSVCYSTAGLFAHLVGTSVWTMLCVRGLVAGLFIFAVIVVWEGRGATARFAVLRALPGLVAVTASVLAMIFNLNAYLNTSVANVVVIYATVPLVAAALSWLLLREPMPVATLGASLVAVVGVLVIVGGSLGRGSLRGDAYAMAMTVSMAVMIVAIRWGQAHSMMAMACASAFASGLVVLPFADFASIAPRDLAVLVLFGITQLGLGLIFLMLGARHLNPSQSALISALDVPLAPLWVWLAFAEVPPAPTVVGGAVVTGAVIFAIRQTRGGETPAEEFAS